MIGRASIGNPWIFNEIKHFLKTGNYLDRPNMTERVEAVNNTLNTLLSGRKYFRVEMKRHYTNYFKGIIDFKPYRIKMVTSDSPEEIQDTLDEVKIKFKEYQF